MGLSQQSHHLKRVVKHALSSAYHSSRATVRDSFHHSARSAHKRLSERRRRTHLTQAPANQAMHESLSLLDHLALLISGAVGTMACAGVFTVLALVSLPAALATGNLVVIVGWVAQTFLQLVLLSVILCSSDLQSRHAELRAEADHEMNARTQELLVALRKDVADLRQELLVARAMTNAQATVQASVQKGGTTLVPMAPRPGQTTRKSAARKSAARKGLAKSQFDPNDPIEE